MTSLSKHVGTDAVRRRVPRPSHLPAGALRASVSPRGESRPGGFPERSVEASVYERAARRLGGDDRPVAGED